jgi:Bacterial Ig-like domain (group 2)
MIMKNGKFINLFIYGFISLVVFLASCGREGGAAYPGNMGVGQTSQVSGAGKMAPILKGISITPSNPLGINAGTRLQFAATGSYSDNSVQDLTTLAVWTSSDTSITTISNAPDSKGQAIAVSRGYCSISATLGSISGSTILGVN